MNLDTGGAGTYIGTPQGPWTKALTAVFLDDVPKVGVALNAVLTPAEATATYQWELANSVDGPYFEIPGATESSYTPQEADAHQYLRVVATGTAGFAGSVASAPEDPVLMPELLYSPSIITLGGPGKTQQITLTAKYPDSTEIDVTADAQLWTEDEGVATVDGTGLVSSVNYGVTNLVAFVDWASLGVSIPVEVTTEPENFTFNSATGTITDYNPAGGTDVIIPSQIGGQMVTGIGDNAFNNKGLTGVVIPNSVTSIGRGAFKSNAVSNLAIPDSVLSIGDEAFRDMNLSEVTIGEGVTSIGSYAFADNPNLGSDAGNLDGVEMYGITLPDSLLSLGAGAFDQNTKLTMIIIGPNVTFIGDSLFNPSNNGFRDAYFDQDTGGAGSYKGTWDGVWIRFVIMA